MGLLSKISRILCSPGRQREVECAAPTQFIFQENKKEGAFEVTGENVPNVQLYNPEKRKSRGGRFFDSITHVAGSRITFVFTLILLIVWAVIGGVLGAPEIWQIVMQDVSSIQCYASDSLLMRQQSNHYYKLLTILSQLRSRNMTVDRLFRNPEIYNHIDAKDVSKMKVDDGLGDAVTLPSEHWFDICCNWASMAVGSMTSLTFYWCGIMVWVGVGNMMEWSDLWQLYINTAVAVELTFTSMFLQNTRRRHMEYLEKSLNKIMESDVELEILLREECNDSEPNPVILITPPPVTRSIRAIDYYGDVVGTGIGAFLSACVFAVWLGVGESMEWDSNWWLIIGTYTGLVGFIDGFVLRNVYFRQDKQLDEQFKVLVDLDEGLYQYLNAPLPTKPVDIDKSIITRISNWMCHVCAMPSAVLFSLIVVTGLICIASVMHWNQTGQLLCNSPTMIIEGFLLIVLIQAHNVSNIKRRVQLRDILVRRLKLLQYAQAASRSIHPNEKHIQEYSQEVAAKKANESRQEITEENENR